MIINNISFLVTCVFSVISVLNCAWLKQELNNFHSHLTVMLFFVQSRMFFLGFCKQMLISSVMVCF